jgi:hypothetical protein
MVSLNAPGCVLLKLLRFAFTPVSSPLYAVLKVRTGRGMTFAKLTELDIFAGGSKKILPSAIKAFSFVKAMSLHILASLNLTGRWE